MPEVLGQPRIERGLEHAPGELVEQPARAHQAHTLFFRLCEQALRELFLIDDLSRHGINHRLVHHLGRVGHGRLLSDQARPHTPFFLQSLSCSQFLVVGVIGKLPQTRPVVDISIPSPLVQLLGPQVSSSLFRLS